MKLMSRLQYKNCESGEYFNTALRTLDETVQLINDFPWALQRELAPIQLTCPSVTVEHPSGSFLKIGPYYNGKFCLYLLNRDGLLLHKIVAELEDAITVFVDFFAEKPMTGFVPHGFVHNSKKYFVKADFEYTVTTRRILYFISYPEGFFLAFLLILPLVRINPEHFFEDFIKGLLFTILFSVVFVGINFYLFFKYMLFSKNLYLRISKGHDNFFFGTRERTVEYQKSDIIDILIYRNHGQRCFWSGYAVIEVYCKNGDILRFPTLLISEQLFRNKLAHDQQIEQIHKWLPVI